MKSRLIIFSFFALVAFQPILNARASMQRTVILMLDGFDSLYYRSGDMPHLNKMERQGMYKIVRSLMPAVTNVNTMAIATGTLPEENGITGNVYFNPDTRKEQYIEDPSVLLAPSVFQQAKARGIRTGLFSVKKKTVDILGTYADVTLCTECPSAKAPQWLDRAGAAPDVYSKEASYWLIGAATMAMQQDPQLGLVYIHTTDYPMHMWPPESPDAKDFLKTLDSCIGALMEAVPDAAFLVTADHGMNHKSLAVDLATVCRQQGTPVRIAISPEKDRYIKHHKGLGGAAYIYLNDPRDATAVRKILLAAPGVEAVLTREEAVTAYHLMPSRIGDFMVTGNKTTVFGELNGAATEPLEDSYRSHGSRYETQVPLFIYNAKHAPTAAYFDVNYKVAAWLFPSAKH